MSDQPIRVITEPGAFGPPGYMVIVRRKIPDSNQLEVESFAVITGTDQEQLDAVDAIKKSIITDPNFASFTVLQFISETRVLEEPTPIIHKPTAEEINVIRKPHVHRSKYSPGDN